MDETAEDIKSKYDWIIPVIIAFCLLFGLWTGICELINRLHVISSDILSQLIIADDCALGRLDVSILGSLLFIGYLFAKSGKKRVFGFALIVCLPGLLLGGVLGGMITKNVENRLTAQGYSVVKIIYPRKSRPFPCHVKYWQKIQNINIHNNV